MTNDTFITAEYIWFQPRKDAAGRVEWTPVIQSSGETWKVTNATIQRPRKPGEALQMWSEAVDRSATKLLVFGVFLAIALAILTHINSRTGGGR